MAIHRLLENSAFEPEQISAMVRAYEWAKRELTVADGKWRASDELIARTVIELAQTGERDATILAEKAVTRLHR